MGDRPDKIKFHPGFYAAAELEFRLEKANLKFEREYNLSKEPLRIDLLVLNDDVKLESEVGKLFKKYNIIEYKSPDDGLTIDDLIKTEGYACLYKALGSTVNEISEEQITISLFRDTYPAELFKYLKETNREIEEKYAGIYYIKGNVRFDAQIVVMNRLSEKHSALKVLSKNAKEEDIKYFLMEISGLKKKADKENADAVLQVSISANEKIYEEIRRNETMCQALEKLMEDVIEEKVEKKVEEKIEVAKQVAKQKEKRNLAKALIKSGKLKLEEIADLTGLSLAEIKTINE